MTTNIQLKANAPDEVRLVSIAGRRRAPLCASACWISAGDAHPQTPFCARDLQFLTSSTYRRAKLSESARLLAAELRSAPAGVFIKPLSATGLQGMPRISQANHLGRPRDTAKPPSRYRKYW